MDASFIAKVQKFKYSLQLQKIVKHSKLYFWTVMRYLPKNILKLTYNLKNTFTGEWAKQKEARKSFRPQVNQYTYYRESSNSTVLGTQKKPY